MHCRRFVIVGPGLIGGSVGLHVHAAGLADRVIGVGRRRSSLDAAVACGAIDEGTLDATEAAEEADFVLLCTRVGLFGEMTRVMAPRMARGGVISDVGSTKEEVVAVVEEAIGDAPVAFVGCHPVAGSERQGVAVARADLFRGHTCIVTPSAKSTPEAIDLVESLWRDCGAAVCRMTPAGHDAVMAEISHLPHLVAAALINSVSDGSLPHAGAGFLSTTRIASGSPELWRDVSATNRDNLVHTIDALQHRLDDLRAALAAGDDDALQAMLEHAKRRRDALLNEQA